jgi:hypothetical protein
MSSPPSSHPPTLIRTDFWFNDGNVILVSQNAAFKVHKGQLARHSEVFADVFSLPQPRPLLRLAGERASAVGLDGKEEGVIDGCPFVVLQDSPKDVFYFLSALYDGMCVPFFL